MPAEVPLEHSQEDIQHHAEHSGEPWIMGVALTAAILAVLAAITALLGEHHGNEAMITQIKASDQWSYYQAKGIKANVLNTRLQLLEALDKPVSEKDREKLEEYQKEQKEIQEKAQELEHESEAHLQHHVVLSRGVTMFQVAIAIGAISVLTRRKWFWYGCMGFGLIGAGFLVQGLLMK